MVNSQALQKKLHKNVLYNSSASDFWLEFARGLSQTIDLFPVFWIANRPQRVENAFPQCTAYSEWNAFKLRDVPPCVIIDKHESYNLCQDISYEEYFTYLKILDRVDFKGSFTFSERDRLLKDQVTFWHAVIKTFSIEFVFFSNVPHLPYNYPLYLVAKWSGIKCVFANTTSVKGWHYFLHELSHEAYSDIFEHINLEEKDLASSLTLKEDLWIKAKKSIQNTKTLTPYYITRQKQSDRSFFYKYRHLFPVAETHVLYSIASKIKHGKLPALLDASPKSQSIKCPGKEYEKSALGIFTEAKRHRAAVRMQRQLRSEMEDCSVTVALDEKFIYVPLHYQPEATTAPLGNLYADQIMLVEALADHLPVGWKVYVKEHYSQFSGTLWGHQGRSPGYYKKISFLKNVYLVDINLDSVLLIENSQAVATITGTAGWEALVKGKPCLAFGLAWYSPCKGVFNIRKPNEIEFALKAIERGFVVEEQFVDDFLSKFFHYAFLADLHGYFGGEIETDPNYVVQKFINYIRMTKILQTI